MTFLWTAGDAALGNVKGTPPNANVEGQSRKGWLRTLSPWTVDLLSFPSWDVRNGHLQGLQLSVVKSGFISMVISNIHRGFFA